MSADQSPLLEVRALSRSFGETRALAEASFSVQAGEVHALAGENGSGKSTMIKILSGALRAHSGEVHWSGQRVEFANPRAAQNAGISTVFQDTLVVPEGSVQDNLFMGTEGMFRHRRSRQDEQRLGAQAMAELGLPGVALERPLRSLSLAEQQIVTIARAIVRPWRLLILDEATSALDASQRDQLFDYLARSRESGRSVLFTSHRMDEIQGLANAVSVLRLGTTVATLPIAEASSRQVLTLMAGRESAVRALGEPDVQGSANVDVAAAPAKAPLVRADDVVLRRGGPAISLEIERGSIFGVAGLEGHGQAEFADMLCGLRTPVSGGILIEHQDGAWHGVGSFAGAARQGIAYVPRDRKREGLFAALSIFDNFAMGSLPQQSRMGVIRRRVIARRFREYAALMRLKSGPPSDLIGTLSGGNQQKVLLGRWLATGPRLLVLNDPLRGVDANTKEELYELFRQLAAEGLTIVLLSSEILELLVLCDRIAVFYDGGLQTVLPTTGTSEADVVSAMFGHEIESGARG